MLEFGYNGEVTAAGIAAILMGIGSMLGGVASVITARNQGKKDEDETTDSIDGGESGSSSGGGGTNGHGV